MNVGSLTEQPNEKNRKTNMNTVSYILLAIILVALYPLFIQGAVKLFKDVAIGIAYLVAIIIRLYRYFEKLLIH